MSKSALPFRTEHTGPNVLTVRIDIDRAHDWEQWSLEIPMPYSQSLELDCRVGAAVEWPLDMNAYVADPAFSEFGPGTPGVHDWWTILLEYLMWQRLPPGHRVICGITIPAFSDDADLAGQAAGIVGYTVETADAVAICNGILEFTENE